MFASIRKRCDELIDRTRRILFKSQGSVHESTGKRGERLAADYLRRKGFRIIKQGRQNWLGEIDIVAVDVRNRRRRTVVFVEVKTWSFPSQGGPSDAVDEAKQTRLTRLALDFLKSHKLLESPARFDVVEVVLNPLSIRHFENAFEAVGKYQWFS
jgi:putative endonuclease